MSETTINQRLNFLLTKLGLKAGAFARALGLSETTIRNYVDRTAKPSSDVLEKISNTFKQVNLVWLVTGEGEPFKEDNTTAQNQTNILGDSNNVASGKGGKAIQNNYTLADCEKERDSLRAERDSLAKQVELLLGQLEMQKTIIEGKDQMLDLLRGGFTRPN